jgi:uncharacterized protein (TIGR02246 family)
MRVVERSKYLRMLLKLSVLLVAVSFCLGMKAQTGTKAEDAVRKVIAQETDAWARYDAKGVASLYTSDSIWQNPFGVRLHGSAELEKFLDGLFQRPGYRAGKNTDVAKITDLRFPSPTVAIVWSEEASQGQVDDSTGKPMLPRHSYYLEVLVKRDGVWKISECMIMDEIRL